jgi:hypothetical protein
MSRPRLASWYSCGTASAVNTKLCLAKFGDTHDITVVRCIVPDENADNDRFAAECQEWFGVPILNLKSSKYSSCEDVWEREKYMSGPAGARCTVEMKKAVRHVFEMDWKPDIQAFGYTADEKDRADRFIENNPDVHLISLLIEEGLSKQDCHAIVNRAGIQLPLMYRLGFDNANCEGCVNAQGPRYWNRTRRHFPEVFQRRAEQSRRLGVRLIKLNTGDRERIYLDELDPNLDDDEAEPMMECSLLCYMAEQKINAQ